MILGFGYTAYYLSQLLGKDGFRIIGTTRNIEKTGTYNSPDYELIPFEKKTIESVLKKTTHLLISTPPSEEHGDPALYGLKEVLELTTQHIDWLAYLSTTGVYGDHQGRWVDEYSEFLKPAKRSLIRIQAEKHWTDFAKQNDLPLHIFRLSGIYGPKRNPLRRLKNGKSFSIFKPDHFFSRIHVEDIVQVLRQSILKPKPFNIFNVADDLPVPSHEVEAFAAELLEMPKLDLIPFEEADLSPMLKDFYTHNRKVSNTKIKNELNVKLKYPNYKKGLEALFQKGDY